MTGSSAINLLDKTQESLTGRRRIYTLYPISAEESSKGAVPSRKRLESLLVYGSYLHVITSRRKQDKVDILKELKTSYLYRDVFDLQGMKNADVFMNLVKALEYQIGNEVSYRELSNLLKISYATVERYLHILEQTFIIFHLPVFKRNKRRELSKLRKIIFTMSASAMPLLTTLTLLIKETTSARYGRILWLSNGCNTVNIIKSGLINISGVPTMAAKSIL